VRVIGRFRRARILWRKLLAASEGAQLLEFAVSLPLLVVFVVGIFDFGQAFNLKQKLSNAAREGARFASSLPTNDLDLNAACAAPASVCATRDLVDSYLQKAKVNDCGLSTQNVTAFTPMSWTFATASGSCPGSVTLTIDRSYPFQATGTGASGPINVINTRVTLSYPYKWQFSNVIKLLVPGAVYAGITQINTDATVPNMD
jgi:Flp pilus assembly protein TadG